MAKRVAREVYIKWYGLGVWKKLRLFQLRREPLCHMCKAEGKTVPATVANHTKAHRGDWDLFVDPKNLDSLCEHHHNSDQQSFEKGGTPKLKFDDDGWPLEDPNELLAKRQAKS